MAAITPAGVSCLLQSDAVGRTSFPQEGSTKSEGASVLGQARAPVPWHSGAAPLQWRLSGRTGWFCPRGFQCLFHFDAVSSLKVSPCYLKYYLVFSIKKASLLNIPELGVSLHPVHTVIGLFSPQPSRCKLSSGGFFISLTFLGSCLAICCIMSLWGLQSCRKRA